MHKIDIPEHILTRAMQARGRDPADCGPRHSGPRQSGPISPNQRDSDGGGRAAAATDVTGLISGTHRLWAFASTVGFGSCRGCDST
jgi:hypothetical protein